MLDLITPNWAILKQPWNWFVVLFAFVTLSLLLHVVAKSAVKTPKGE